MPESIYDLCINCSFLTGKLFNTLANIIKREGGCDKNLELNLSLIRKSFL